MPETVGDRLVRGAKGRPLDGLGSFCGTAVGAFYRVPGSRALKDLLHGTWLLRHPLHPAVTDVVVGGLTVVAALDVVSLVQGDDTLSRATIIALIVSLAFAVVAALSGYTDWNETYGNERRLGILHGTLMLLVTTGYVVSLALRLGDGPREPALWLGLLMWVSLALVSHLGGEMVFGFGAGVNRQAWAAVPTRWQATGVSAGSLEDRRPLRATLKNGFAVMLVKVEGELHAIGAVCTHAGGPLDEGELVGSERRDIKCPWHASVFSVRTGTALRGPATMDEPTFDVRVADSGTVEVRARGAG